MDTLSDISDLVEILVKAASERKQIISRTELHRGKDFDAKMLKELVGCPEITDTELAHNLLGIAPTQSGYRARKAQLKRKLLNTLFVLDLKRAGSAESTVAEYENNLSLVLARTLLMFGARKQAHKLAVSSLKTAKHWELWGNAAQLLILLRTAVAFTGDSDAWRRYRDEYQRLSHLESVFQEALTLYEGLIIPFVIATGEHTDLISGATLALSKVSDFHQKHGTFRLALMKFRMQALNAQILMDYTTMVEVCREFEQTLEENQHFHDKVMEREIALKLLMGAVQTRDITHGEEALGRCLTVIPPHSNNWFAVKEQEFFMRLHTADLALAHEVMYEVVGSPRFPKQPIHRHERWEVFALYLKYAEGNLKQSGLLGYIVAHKADKSGLHASVKVLEVLVLIKQKKFSAAFEKMDALLMYRSRYLREPESEQLSLFIRMLKILEKHSFDPKLAEVAARNETAALQRLSAQALAGIQVIPYETLWRDLLSQLGALPPTV